MAPRPSLALALLLTAVILLTADHASAMCSCSKGKLSFSAPGRTFRSRHQACRNALLGCFRKRCNSRFGGCRGFPRCYAAKQTAIRVGRGRFRCKVLCNGGVKQCRNPGGHDDPHMRGFDGSRFDFHGEHGRHYVIFGRDGGDVVSATMRGADVPNAAPGPAPTFFNAFGVRARSGARVRVALQENVQRPGRWEPFVEVDGTRLATSGGRASAPGADVSIGKFNIVRVRTADNEFEFAPARLHSERERHLNLAIDRLSSSSPTDRYVGVLGWTLNKKLGLRVEDELNVAERSAQDLETSLRARFEVDDIFAEHAKAHMLTGIVARVAVSDVAKSVVDDAGASANIFVE